jgi:Ca2+-binding RTX toxin-like protein
MPIYLITTHKALTDNLNGSGGLAYATPEIDTSNYDIVWIWESFDPNPSNEALGLHSEILSAVVTTDRDYMKSIVAEFRGVDGRDTRVYVSMLGEDGAISGTRVMNVKTIVGTERDNVLRGSDLIEDIFGGAGDDAIYGGGKRDRIYGEAGNDRLDGGDSTDQIYGGAGRDWIFAGVGLDEVYGGAGSDRIKGQDEPDLIYGGRGNDVIDGGTGIDAIYGEAGNDRIRGGDENTPYDQLSGGDGDDFLQSSHAGGRGYMRGDAGNDTLLGYGNLSGGEGNDRLEGFGRMSGDAGNDVVIRTHRDSYSLTTLSGGEGTDRFIFTYQEDDNVLQGLRAPSQSSNEILDFDPATEKIDLRRTQFDSLDDFVVSERPGYFRLSWDGHDTNLFSITIDADVSADNFIF